MGKKIQVWIDESMVQELKKIQDSIRKQVGDIDLSQPQASVIAAKHLRENPPKISAELIKSKHGRRAIGFNVL